MLLPQVDLKRGEIAETDHRFDGTKLIRQSFIQEICRAEAAARADQGVDRRTIQGVKEFSAAFVRRAGEVALGIHCALWRDRETETFQFSSACRYPLFFGRRGRCDWGDARTVAKSFRLLPGSQRCHSCCLSTGSISRKIPGRVMAASTFSCW